MGITKELIRIADIVDMPVEDLAELWDKTTKIVNGDTDFADQALLEASSPTFASPDFSGTLTVNTINEHTGAAGVTIDGVKMKDKAIVNFSLGAMAEVTISSGVITITGSNNVVDTESDAALDELDNIAFTGVVDGTIISIRSANSARDIDVRDVITVGVGGNLQLVGNITFRLTHPRDRMLLMWHSLENIWVELIRSDIA